MSRNGSSERGANAEPLKAGRRAGRHHHQFRVANIMEGMGFAAIEGIGVARAKLIAPAIDFQRKKPPDDKARLLALMREHLFAGPRAWPVALMEHL